MDLWNKLTGQLVLCGVKAEIRNRKHSYCGAAKQIKMVWSRLKEG